MDIDLICYTANSVPSIDLRNASYQKKAIKEELCWQKTFSSLFLPCARIWLYMGSNLLWNPGYDDHKTSTCVKKQVLQFWQRVWIWTLAELFTVFHKPKIHSPLIYHTSVKGMLWPASLNQCHFVLETHKKGVKKLKMWRINPAADPKR